MTSNSPPVLPGFAVTVTPNGSATSAHVKMSPASAMVKVCGTPDTSAPGSSSATPKVPEKTTSSAVGLPLTSASIMSNSEPTPIS